MKLFEIQKQYNTRTKTKTADAVDTSAFDRAFQDDMFGTQNVPQQRQQTGTPRLKRAAAADTKSKMQNVKLSPDAGEKLSFLQSLELDDEISDDEAARNADIDFEPTETTPSTIPAVINKGISAATDVDPDWHQVKNLPGYLSTPIRKMGRQVFGTWTNTPIEDITLIANLQGQGPNSKRELNAVAGWLKQNAQLDTEGTMNFEKTIPDYDADFNLYTSNGQSFLVVKDFAGEYVYSWPSADEKRAQEGHRPGIKAQRQRLR